MTVRVDLSDVVLAYGRDPVVRLSGRFAPGSLTALIGPNGAGKSSLLKAIAGLLRPTGGRIALDGAGRGDIGYLPQLSGLDPAFPMAVGDVVTMGLWRRIGMFSPVSAAMREKVRAALVRVGLSGLAGRPFDSLSQGQRQRALFARLMVSDSPLILLDEPFSAMDEPTIADLLGLIAEWHGQGRTLIVALHDLDLARESFPETLLLSCDAIAWGATSGVLRPENLAKAGRRYGMLARSAA